MMRGPPVRASRMNTGLLTGTRCDARSPRNPMSPVAPLKLTCPSESLSDTACGVRRGAPARGHARPRPHTTTTMAVQVFHRFGEAIDEAALSDPCLSPGAGGDEQDERPVPASLVRDEQRRPERRVQIAQECLHEHSKDHDGFPQLPDGVEETPVGRGGVRQPAHLARPGEPSAVDPARQLHRERTDHDSVSPASPFPANQARKLALPLNDAPRRPSRDRPVAEVGMAVRRVYAACTEVCTPLS
jgi:hypothetical protein